MSFKLAPGMSNPSTSQSNTFITWEKGFLVALTKSKIGKIDLELVNDYVGGDYMY